MTPNAQRGRSLLAIAIAVTLFGDAIVISLTVARSGLSGSSSSLIRWLITIALFYAVWQGHRWARWLMVGLLSLGLLLVIPPMLRTLHPLLISVALQFAAAVGLLAFPPSVSAFLTFQRRRRNENT